MLQWPKSILDVISVTKMSSSRGADLNEATKAKYFIYCTVRAVEKKHGTTLTTSADYPIKYPQRLCKTHTISDEIVLFSSCT